MPKYNVKLCECRSCRKTYFVDKEDIKQIKQCPFCGMSGGYHHLTNYVPIPHYMVPEDLKELFDREKSVNRD